MSRQKTIQLSLPLKEACPQSSAESQEKIIYFSEMKAKMVKDGFEIRKKEILKDLAKSAEQIGWLY